LARFDGFARNRAASPFRANLGAALPGADFSGKTADSLEDQSDKFGYVSASFENPGRLTPELLF
jgi:hypothetical protein